MEWIDQAIIIGSRKHGEKASIVQMLTKNHGKHAGLLSGGSTSSKRHLVEPGKYVSAIWRGRLPEHLGRVNIELERSFGAVILGEPKKLAALNSICEIILLVLPERESHNEIFMATLFLLQNMANEQDDIWLALYVRWELGLLGALGFGLQLSTCAVTGQTNNLAYVSPKTGRAVTMDIGLPYKDQLFVLPDFLSNGERNHGNASYKDIVNGAKLTGYFLEKHVFATLNKTLPPMRNRFFDLMNKEI